jgi:autotransporter family porin
LLLSTALVSTLLLGCLLAPTRASAFTCAGDVGTGPAPISHPAINDFIICVNTEARTNAAGNAISLQTLGNNYYIDLYNSGVLAATALGIITFTDGDNSPITIVNLGDITAISVAAAFGIDARTFDTDSSIHIANSAGITASAASIAFGIDARTYAANSPISIVNSGDITATGSTFLAYGIAAMTFEGTSPIDIDNSGDITVTAEDRAYGIFARTGSVATDVDNSPITIVNSGDITVTTAGDVADAYGIFARPFSTQGDTSPIDIVNSGDIAVTTAGDAADAYGILARPFTDTSPTNILNSGDIAVTTAGYAADASGITALAFSDTSPIDIETSGDIAVTTTGDDADVNGILAATDGIDSPVAVKSSGDIAVTTAGVDARAYGIAALTFTGSSPIDIENSGHIAVAAAGDFTEVVGIFARTVDDNSPIRILNSGKITASGDFSSFGIQAVTEGANSPINIINSGDISAASLFAIQADGGAASIFNRGLITGFVDLTDNADTFINQQGGVVEARLTSYFGLSDDRFRNEQGGLVHTAADSTAAEFTSFVALERFENRGFISLQDGKEDDVFQISNTLGATDLEFVGSGQSALAVDAFLGGPGSTSDTFIIDGNISGGTAVKVNNTNLGPGVFNKEGIPVVFVNGNANGDEFFLNNPIDTGFFNYDLFFRPTGSGVFELRSFIGPGAFVLPQLITSAQDIWHVGSSTWFDRTADLRVLLNGGGAPTAYDPEAKYAEGTPTTPGITPAVWVRGAGNWLDREDSESVTAYGRSYKYNLNRDLETIDFQGGIDFGKRGLLSDNDILVFGALGGFIHADLDYDAPNRAFDYEGGQVGGYATYLRGGLFVDTLLNVHLLQIDTKTLGFPSSLDATTVGLRTDTGYRFGSFSGGAFLEPLATLSVNWADIDGFALGGNKVSFDDEANVRGRLALRVGTSFPIWAGTTMEPFVIGSLWGNLTDSNEATLVSSGTTFHLEDDLDDVWGEVSVGANFFNPTASTSVFAKLDVTFGDDVEGIGGKAGIRVSW